MCGLCGIALREGKDIPRALMERMNGAVGHRGPDGDGFLFDRNVALGHRRLSIIDLAGGAQPIYNEDRSVCVILNGELYNYRELTDQLLRQGHVFRTQSDTETLVHLYEQHGMAMLGMLHGMFAFALFDIRARTLYLVRDRFGIKPLYYWLRDGALYFASEVKALIAAGYTPEPNLQAINLYLASRFAHGDETIFQGVRRLAEGSYLVWHEGDISLHRYYANPGHFSVDDRRDFQGLFDDAFAAAVSSHMVSDVPVGAYLSGGVDSSAVVSEMTRLTGHPVRTFCVDFKNGFSEAAAAEATARQLGCEHETVLCGVDEVLHLPRVIETLEEPVGDAVVVAQYFLSRATRNAGIKVVLTGDGADETLGGYQYLRAIIQAIRWRDRLPAMLFSTLGSAVAKRIPVAVIDRLAGVPLDVASEARQRLVDMLQGLPQAGLRDLYDLLLALYRPTERDELYTSTFRQQLAAFPNEHLAGEPVGRTLADRVLSMQYRRWLPANINLKQDKLCMAHSVENRVPFLDHQFVELLTTFPERTKIAAHGTKLLLRDLVRRRLGSTAATGQKVPFHLPLERYLGDPRLWALIEENLTDDRVRRRGLLQVDYVRHIKERSRHGDYMTAKKLFALVILELWFRIFIDRE